MSDLNVASDTRPALLGKGDGSDDETMPREQDVTHFVLTQPRPTAVSLMPAETRRNIHDRL
jgi:hypothetical protein